MVLVTDKQFYMAKDLKIKFDLAIERYHDKRDSLFIVEGAEGDGKSTATIGWAYYIAHTLQKPFTVDNVFFDAKEMLKFAANNEGQVIVWDEAATAALASQWQRGIQQKLIQILMMARKKRHFFFFVIPKFWKMNEYIVDRAIGMMRVYSPDLIKRGHFVYFKKDQKDWLYQRFVRDKKRSYKGGWSFRGTFTTAGFVIDETKYDAKKDAAISALFEDDKPRESHAAKRLRDFQQRIANLPGFTKIEKAKWFDVSPQSLSNWAKGGCGDNQVQSPNT